MYFSTDHNRKSTTSQKQSITQISAKFIISEGTAFRSFTFVQSLRNGIAPHTIIENTVYSNYSVFNLSLSNKKTHNIYTT